MLGIGYGFFIRVASDGNKCILRPAEITASTPDFYSATLKEEGMEMAVGDEFLVYYEIRQKFVKQAARIESVQDDPEAPSITFLTVGEPMSAENRQEFRVSTVMSDIFCTVGDEISCAMLDVSAKGFAALAKTQHAIGTILDVDIQHEGQRFSGKVCVQSIKDRGGDVRRYGLRCVEDKSDGTNLAIGLWQVSMALQRQQLRRMAGTK